jgi:hypothetical protein
MNNSGAAVSGDFPIAAGLGASHQTDWTGLVAKLIQQGEFGTIAKPNF